MKFNTASEGYAFPTPHSWEMASNIMNAVSDDIEAVRSLVAGCIGHDYAFYLASWCEIFETLPSIKSIFEGQSVEIPVLWIMTKGIDTESFPPFGKIVFIK